MRIHPRIAGLCATVLILGGVSVASAGTAAAASVPVCNIAVWQTDTNFDGPARDFRQYVPAINAVYYAKCQLARGATGDGVRALQTALNVCYAKGLTVDGSYGPATKAAVVAIQKQFVIPADGVWGPQTRYYMNVPGYWTDNGSYKGCSRG